MVSEISQLTNYVFNTNAFLPLFVGILSGLFGLSVLVREKKNVETWAFFALTASMMVSLVCHGILLFSSNVHFGILWARGEDLGLVFVPSFLLLFVTGLTGHLKSRRKTVAGAFALSGIFSVLILFTDWFVSGVESYFWGFHKSYEMLSIPFLVFFAGVFFVSLKMLWQEAAKSLPGVRQNRMRDLFLSIAVASVLCVDFLPSFGVPFYPFGYLAVYTFIIMSAMAIGRYHLTDVSPMLMPDQIIQTIPDPVFVLNCSGNICLVNPAACRIFGLPEEKLIGKPMNMFDKRLFDETLIKQLLETGSISGCEMSFTLREGAPIVLSVSASCVRHPLGYVIAYVWVGRDITGMKEAEESRRRAYDILEDRVAERTRELARLNESLVAEIVERRKAEEELRKAHDELEQKVEERTEELSCINKTLQKEIAEREWVERNLKAYSHEICDLYNNAPCGYLSVDVKGVVVRINDTLLSWLGFTKDETLHRKKITEFLSEADGRKFMGQFGALKVHEKSADLELSLRRKDGSYIPVVLSSSAVVDDSGGFVMSRSMVFDMTEIRKMQGELMKKTAELARSKAEKEHLDLFAFVAASHDLKEPLEKIVAYGEFLKERYGPVLDERGIEYLGRVEAAALKINELIEDILKFSKVASRNEQFKPVEIEGVVEEVLSGLEKQLKESNALVEVGKLPTVNGDAEQIHHMFHNLVSNAVKFRKADELPRIIIRSEESGEDFVEIIVEDNGIGFDMQYAEEIFKPFEHPDRSKDRDGSGLGLAKCRIIALKHGGKISARSIQGQGSAFIITFPKIDAAVTEKKAA